MEHCYYLHCRSNSTAIEHYYYHYYYYYYYYYCYHVQDHVADVAIIATDPNINQTIGQHYSIGTTTADTIERDCCC